MQYILILLITFPAFAQDCGKHPTYCTIKKHTGMSKAHAMKLSNAIHEQSVKYNIPKKIFTAILLQESMLKLVKGNCFKGIDLHGKVNEVCQDFGISQINYKNVLKSNISLDKLMTDMVYSIEQGAIILSWFEENYSKKDKYWWSYYNCGLRGDSSRTTCQEYIKRVKRFL